jgi:hypothetical protein
MNNCPYANHFYECCSTINKVGPVVNNVVNTAVFVMQSTASTHTDVTSHADAGFFNRRVCSCFVMDLVLVRHKSDGLLYDIYLC